MKRFKKYKEVGYFLLDRQRARGDQMETFRYLLE